MASPSERRVVVTGLGVVGSLGHDIDTMWRNIVAGQCGIDRITQFDAAPFATQIAAEIRDWDPVPAFPSPKDARRADRYSQTGIYAGWKALQDSGLDLNSVNLDN